MDCPDWYPDWRHEAVHLLQSNNARVGEEFKLGGWPRYDYDLDTRTLTFSDADKVMVRAEIQVVGSTSISAGNWLWGWANSHWPEDCVSDAMRVRAFGQEHGICDLTHEYLADDDLNALGWELTAVAARICDSQYAYRPPRNEGGGLYLLCNNLTWAN